MDTTRAEQIALDDALVAPANRLKLSKVILICSDSQVKEATFKWSMMGETHSIIQGHSSSTDVPDISCKEFLGQASVHHHSIRVQGVPECTTYDSDDEQISWKSSEEHNEDEVNDDDNDDDVDKDINDDDTDNQDDDDDEQTDSDNDGDDFIHPKLSTHDDEARKDDEVNEEESNEASDDESNEESDEEVQGANTEDEEMDEEATHEEDEANELYRDVNVNLDGRDTVMTDAPLPNVQATQETKDTHMIIMAPINPEGQQQSSSVSSGFVSNMLNPRPDTGIDLIFTLNTEATSLVDVPVTTIAEPPLVSATTLPPPPTPLITRMQQTPVPTPTTVPSSSLSSKRTNLLKQSLPFPALLMCTLPTRCMKPSKLLLSYNLKIRDEGPSEDADFLTIDDNIIQIIKDQVIGTKMKKILIDKMESNKSIHRSDEQKNLYKELVEAYESDKLILDTYGDIVSFKRRRDDEDKYKEPSAGKEPESTSTLKEKNPKLLGKRGPRESFDELMDTPLDFSAFMMNRFKVDTLTPKLLAGPTFELMKGTCKRLVELEYFFEEGFARDVYSKRRIIAVTKLQIVEWHGYKHLDWITVRKLTNLNVEDRLAFGVSLRMFTRSIVIQRHVEDLQLGVESY
ncbi:hypothetical protein Tco_0534408 [Tanacetum coccineum]